MHRAPHPSFGFVLPPATDPAQPLPQYHSVNDPDVAPLLQHLALREGGEGELAATREPGFCSSRSQFLSSSKEINKGASLPGKRKQ